MMRHTARIEDTLVDLSDQEAAQFVMDDWSWKAAWAANTMSYISED